MSKYANFEFFGGIALCILLISGVAFLAIEPAVDDAFIVHRYVDRFIQGKGLTFNDGEYVEGYTSLLWTVLLSGISKAGVRPHIAALWFNYISIILIALLMLWLLTILNISKSIKLTILILYGISVLYFKVIFLGLEFALYILLLLVFLCIVLLSYDNTIFASKYGKQAALVSGLIGAGLFATRPEAIIILPASLLLTYRYRRDNRNVRLYIAIAFFTFVICILVVLTWRFLYYDQILPNSVIAKSTPLNQLWAKQAAFNRFNWLKGIIIYFWKAYTSSPALLLELGLFALAFWKKWRPYEMSLLLVPILWHHIVIIENGGDWMPYSRFVTIYVPLFLASLALVMEETRKESSVGLKILLLLLISLHTISNAHSLDLINILTDVREIGDPDYMYQVVGQALHEVWLEGDVLIPEAGGRISYVMPDTYIHEPNGLVDVILANDETAKRSVFGRMNWSYSLGLNPAVIILHYWPHQHNWKELLSNYPEDYAFYCMPPLPNLSRERMLYIIIREDRIAQYSPALKRIGAQPVEYFTDPDITQPLICK